MANPLLQPFDTEFGLPPFAQIETLHFDEALQVGFDAARDAIAAIKRDPAPASFDNTIVALEQAERVLDRVAAVFFNLAGTDATPQIEALMREWSPKFAAFASEVMMDPDLFSRVDTVFASRGEGALTSEELRVLELYHRNFLRAGAMLDQSGKERLAKIMERLAVLGTSFSQNILADERDWFMALEDGDLEGLPSDVVAAASAAARERGHEGCIITLNRSLIVPFLEYSSRPDLRQRAFSAWTMRGMKGGPTDTRAIVAEILALRHERAQLLGYESFAAFKLEKEMAKTPDAVRTLLSEVWEPALQAAEREADSLAKLAFAEGQAEPLAPCDWRYFAEKQRKLEHDLDTAEVKPYLQLDRMIAAQFDVAGRLFGLSFAPLDVVLHHPDARAWQVLREGEHIGVFIGDYFARPEKRSGAWCSSFLSQHKLGGDIRPITMNVCNFVKAEPALLTWDDARTLFHEFGHALHNLMSDVTYPSISGTSVARDFVELPSQLYEHWLTVPEILRTHARHVETDQPMPEDLVTKILGAENFGQGFATVEYLASAFVDLEFHAGRPPTDPMQTQAEILMRLGMPSAITMRHATPHFQHVFSGDGYSSGYYSYLWSEVMDADAFAAFEETGDPFDPALAARLLQHVYAAGGSQDAEALYTAFRGKMPGAEALLKGRGLAA